MGGGVSEAQDIHPISYTTTEHTTQHSTAQRNSTERDLLTFEHGHGVRAHRHVEEAVYPQLGDCVYRQARGRDGMLAELHRRA